jgi:hypothetical protein
MLGPLKEAFEGSFEEDFPVMIQSSMPRIRGGFEQPKTLHRWDQKTYEPLHDVR